jgi:hypothetical protein
MHIVAHRVVHVQRKIRRNFLARKTLLLIQQWRKYVLSKIFLVPFLPLGRASRAINCRAVKTTEIVTFLIKIPGLSLRITSSRPAANIESDSRMKQTHNSSSVAISSNYNSEYCSSRANNSTEVSRRNFSESWIVDAIFGRIFAIQVLLTKCPSLWNVIHWSASLWFAHWRAGNFPGNFTVVVPRLRAVFRVELRRDRNRRPYWSEQAIARSGLVKRHPNQAYLWVPSGSFGRLSLSAKRNREVLIAELSPWMWDSVF